MSISSESIGRVHYRACNLCEAICGLEIVLDKNDEILSIKGDEKDPLSRGHICPKAVALKDIYQDPNRLKQPIKKTTSGWETISWEQAFAEVTENIKSIQAKYGKNGVAVYTGNPAVHNSGTIIAGSQFVKSLGTENRFSATSVDQLPHHFVSLAMFGHHMTLPIPDIDRTDFFLIMGGNPLASNGSMMTVPNVQHRLRNIQKRGGKVIVVDPRFTETSKIADQHLFIKPGTDAFLLMAIIYEIVWDPKFGNSAIFEDEEFEEFNKYLQKYSPKSVSAIIGIPEKDIIQLAKELMNAKTAVVYGRMGLSTQAFGGVCQWLINLINIFNTNFDKPGGAMFPDPAFSLYAAAKKGYKATGRFHSKVRNLPEFEGELPVSTMAEELLHPDGPKAFISICGNPVLSTPNGEQLEKAIQSLSYKVSVDIYLNETSRLADIILPPTTGLEVAHYDIVFHQLAVRNTAKYSEPMHPRAENQRHDWEIFEELRNRLQTPENEPIPVPQNPELKIDYMLRNGKYAEKGVSIEKLKEKPQGIDLGELKACLNEKLYTNNGKINKYPASLMADLERLALAFEQYRKQKDDQIVLIGRRHLRSNNSWMHNSQRLIKGGNRCTVLMNKETASKYNIIDNQSVEVSSRVGKVVLPAEISDEIMPNVVSIPHGFGHNKEGINLEIASQNAGVSINELTDELLIDELTGNAAFSGVPVFLKAV